MDEKVIALRRMKRLPLLLLLLAAAIFITTLFLPPARWVSGLKAVAEAAMVGALADWFAVVALFRRVPIPLIARHTAIVPNNQQRIADNLARFVQDKFLDTDSLLALIRRHDPIGALAGWLAQPENAARLGGHLNQLLRGLLALTDDVRIQHVVRQAVHKAIDKVDLTQSAAVVLDSLTRNQRHQALLDSAISQLLTLMQKPATRAFIADQVVRWLRREHPIKEKILPSEWLGEHSAEAVTRAVHSLLDEVSHDEGHALRQGFDRAVARLIDRLKQDPEMAGRAEQIKAWLKADPALNRYIADLWGDLRGWLKQDLQDPQSSVARAVSRAGAWLGETLQADEALRASLNQHLENAARAMAPEFSTFLTRHISDTVKSWDAREMSRQIELNIGKDLQYIRINGTLVGGAVGLLLFLISQLPYWLGL
ncbi:DUF445 domain-containing protein [Pantoea sp. 1.19]|uniref:DUF445 domain-containing protein n=1 Tax=Pantoea sp. 1.19 TaxID=1925589 RepID=UPI00094918B5|nr:DUF445 family protein [Pantoea sp. 1.19]